MMLARRDAERLADAEVSTTAAERFTLSGVPPCPARCCRKISAFVVAAQETILLIEALLFQSQTAQPGILCL